MARKDKAGLYIDTQNLFAVLYQAQFELPKRDRPVIVNRMLGHCESIIGNFSLAYQSENKKGYIDSFIAEFEALKVICRFVIDNLLKNEKTKFKNIKRLYEMIDTRWMKLYTMNWDRLCLSAGQGYGYKDILKLKTI